MGAVGSGSSAIEPVVPDGVDLLTSVINPNGTTTFSFSVGADVAHHARQARSGRLVMLLDRVIIDDEAPWPGELASLKAGLEILVALFRVGEG